MNGFSSSYGLGLVFIVVVSFIWAASSILVQYLYTNQSFDSPFLLTYIGVSLFTVFLPLEWIRQGGSNNESAAYARIPTLNVDHDEDWDDNEAPVMMADNDDSEPGAPLEQPWTTRDHMIAAAKISPVWFLSNYSYNASLEFTSITSSTVLASTGSLFTFLFALLYKDEHFCIWKLMGVGLGMFGSIMTGLHDVKGSKDDIANEDLRLWGDFLGLISAVGYGGYAVMIRTLCPRDESLMSMQKFLGFVGLFNMVALSPIAFWQSINAVALSGLVLGSLVIKGLLDNVLSDYLWARAVVLTSATVATVGLGLTIPLAFFSDVVLGRPNVLQPSSIFGALSVLAGFILVNIGQKQVDGEATRGEAGSHDESREEASSSDDTECVELRNEPST